MKFFGKLLVCLSFGLVVTGCAESPIHVQSTTVVYNQPPRNAYEERPAYYQGPQRIYYAGPQPQQYGQQYGQQMPATVTQTTGVIWFGASAGSPGPYVQPRR